MEVKVIKLSTGEELVSRCEENEDEVILNNPMTLQPIQTHQQGTMGMALIPWLMAGKCERVVINQAEKNYLANVTGLTL